MKLFSKKKLDIYKLFYKWIDQPIGCLVGMLNLHIYISMKSGQSLK